MEFDENMNKKYGFIGETMVIDGHKLHRIFALNDILDSDGNTIAEKGDLGE